MIINNFFKKNLTFYRHPKDMPLISFLNYLETQDLKYFTKEEKYHKDLNEIMTIFFGYYIELSKNNSIINRFSIIYEIMRNETKYNTMTILLKIVYNYNPKLDIEVLGKLIEQIEKWGYKIDKTKSIFSQIENISIRLQNIKTKIELLKSNLKEEDDKTVVTIESQILTVERILELGYKINKNKITVLEWIEYQMQAKEINERNKIK